MVCDGKLSEGSVIQVKDLDFIFWIWRGVGEGNTLKHVRDVIKKSFSNRGKNFPGDLCRLLD